MHASNPETIYSAGSGDWGKLFTHIASPVLQQIEKKTNYA